MFAKLFTGKVPFHEFSVPAVIIKVTREERPGRPQQTLQLGLCDDVWDLVKLCWRHEPKRRPKITFVLNRLRTIAPQISLLERLVDFDLNSESSIDILRSLLESPMDEVLAADPESTGVFRFVEVLDQVNICYLLRTTLITMSRRWDQNMQTLYFVKNAYPP
jgi:hypothetical protein